MRGLLKFSTTLLLYLTEVIQKATEFHRGAVKIKGMAIAGDISDVSHCERIRQVIEHCKGRIFNKCVWRKDEELVSRAFQLSH